MSNDRWPMWLRTLGPDELTRRRMRRAILDEAQPLLGARRNSWPDMVAEWATILSPVAAAVTLIFAGLALRQAGAQKVLEGVTTIEEVFRVTQQ